MPKNVALNNIIQIVAPGTPNIFELAGDRNIMSLDLEGKAKMAVGGESRHHVGHQRTMIRSA